jgi:hypothetical protein
MTALSALLIARNFNMLLSTIFLSWNGKFTWHRKNSKWRRVHRQGYPSEEQAKVLENIGYEHLKIKSSEKHNFNFLPTENILYLKKSSHPTGPGSIETWTQLLLANTLHKINAVAVDIHHWDFEGFLNMFGACETSELVFIVVNVECDNNKVGGIYVFSLITTRASTTIFLFGGRSSWETNGRRSWHGKLGLFLSLDS